MREAIMKRNLVKATITIAPWFFLFFVACGGNDKPQAPPVSCGGPGGKCHEADLESKANAERMMAVVKQTCAQAFGPAIMQAAQITYMTNGQVPPQVMFSQGPAADALRASAPQQSQCTSAINQLILNVSTMEGGRYWQRPDVQEWLQGNLASIGDSIASQFPPQVYQNPNFIPAMINTGKYVVGTYIKPQIQNARAQAELMQRGIGMM